MSLPAPAPAPAPMSTQQFTDLGKVPDFVRDVKPFSGDPTQLINWISDVDAIFRTYRENGATPIQISVLGRTVRRKIEGEAGDVLNSNNILTDWHEIKNTLLLYYKYQRDVKTLDYPGLLSFIIAQVQTDDTLKLSTAAHINYFRE